MAYVPGSGFKKCILFHFERQFDDRTMPIRLAQVPAEFVGAWDIFSETIQ
jgi:hypothetical protein